MSTEYAVNAWQERVLTFEVTIVWPYLFGRQFTTTKRMYCSVSEHAVQRLYQRTAWPEMPTPALVVPALRELVLWADIWWSALCTWLLRMGDVESYGLAFVPTSGGAWLGNIAAPQLGNFPMMDLRTYVSTEQMRPNQLRLWHAGREIQRGLDSAQCLDEMVLRRLCHDEFAPQLWNSKAIDGRNGALHALFDEHAAELLPASIADAM